LTNIVNKSDLIEKRYHESINNLKSAINETYRIFIFDNSFDKANLIIEVFTRKEITYKYQEVPSWVDKLNLENT
jgi:predicted ABC-type ATPase